MDKIKCAIIDDEPFTGNVLSAYISELDTLELVGTFYNPIDALMYLQHNKIDLLFLDIMLPKVTGSAFLHLIPCRPKVIFLSAKRYRKLPRNSENVLYTLLKPIVFEEFLKSIERYYAAMSPVISKRIMENPSGPTGSSGPFVYLYSGRIIVKVFLNEILYVEGVKNYAKIKTIDREIIVYQGLAAIEMRLRGKGFIRIHRSLIVAAGKITAFSTCSVEIGTHILPVSAQYRRQLVQLINSGLKNV